MTLLHFLLLLLIAGVCGSIAQALVGGTPGGCFVSIALGFIGALLGTWLAQLMGLPDVLVLDIAGQPFPVV